MLDNSFDKIFQLMGSVGYAQPSESLDLSVSSPQLKRPNRNATPNFRSASEINIDTGFGDNVGGDGIDRQFVLEEGSSGVGHNQYLLPNAQGCDLLEEGDIANIGPSVDPETNQPDEGAYDHLGTFDDLQFRTGNEAAEEGVSANYLSEYDDVQLAAQLTLCMKMTSMCVTETISFALKKGAHQH